MFTAKNINSGLFISHLFAEIKLPLIHQLTLQIITGIILVTVILISAPVNGQEDTDSGGNLHLAVLQGNINAVQQLIESGANINKRDQFGSTPLIIAVTFGRDEIASMLLNAGADINVTNNEGSTPLHLAALFGRTEIVKTLLNQGADRDIRNNSGATAYDIVAIPFETDKQMYDGIQAAFKPLGLVLDYKKIKNSRPEISGLLKTPPDQLTEVNYTPLPGDDWNISTPIEQGLDPVFVAELYHDAAQMENLYGLLIIKNGFLVAEDYFNDGAEDQKAGLQSVTKSFTSALVGIALDQDDISGLDQKMIDFFPEFADKITDKRKNQITIRDMLEMRAGFPWEEMTESHFNILFEGFKLHHIMDIPLTIDPGKGFQYSNFTSHLLGIIVARASKKDLRTFARENLFDKMNFGSDEWTRGWEGYYSGHADLYLTARDIAKFGLSYQKGGIYKGEQIIPSDWVKGSLQNYSEDAWITKDRVNYVGRYFRELGYGYQWWSASIGDYRFNFAWGHGGQLIVLLDRFNMVIVVTSFPYYKQHDDEAWKHERANFNLVGKFIQNLIKDN